MSELRTVGICRFSYAGEGGFKVGHDDHATLEAFLYGAARMEERFRLFEAITLPCVAAQTDPDFTFLIVQEPTFRRTTLNGCTRSPQKFRNASSSSTPHARTGAS